MMTPIANPFTGKNTIRGILLFMVGLLMVNFGCSPAKSPTPKHQTTTSHQPHHLGVKATLYYHTSIENKWMYRQLYTLAENKLLANFTAQTWETQPAVILDIDETVLDNSRYEIENIANGKTYELASWKAWTARAEAPALPGALQFCQLADSLGIKVVYLSNREVDETEGTRANLVKFGFPQTENLLLKSVQSDKTARRAVVQKDHTVLLYLGDNFRDFSETLANRSSNFGADALRALEDSLDQYFVLFPNPMYGEWEKPVAPALDHPSEVLNFLDN